MECLKGNSLVFRQTGVICCESRLDSVNVIAQDFSQSYGSSLVDADVLNGVG